MLMNQALQKNFSWFFFNKILSQTDDIVRKQDPKCSHILFNPYNNSVKQGLSPFYR